VQHTNVGNFREARDQIVEERGGQRLSVLVVGNFLVERRTETLRHAAHHLRFDDHGVHHGAAVVADDVVEDLDLPRPRVNRDRAGMRRIGKRAGAAPRLIDCIGLKRRFFSDRKPLRVKKGRLRDVAEADALLAEIDLSVS